MKLSQLCCSFSFALAIIGCDSGSSNSDATAGTDATVTRDATVVVDSGLSADTGIEAVDTGVAPADTGVAPADTGVAPADTGVEPADTGVAADTGVEPADAGVAADTGVEPADTGVAVDTGVVADSGVAADSGIAADAGQVNPACTAYCATIMSNCTAGNAQYPSTDSCLGACASFPPGNVGATSGNSLGCRTYHAGNAAANANVHCPHAGPSGAGVCGTLCEGFCEIQAVACTGANEQYANPNACAVACAGFPTGAGNYNTGHTQDNSNYCRLYHLSVAASGPQSANNHCGHIVAASTTCTQ